MNHICAETLPIKMWEMDMRWGLGKKATFTVQLNV